jgi:hypothetical protein
MRARVGDWLVVPPEPHASHGRRGQIVGLVHADGSPPYRVHWLEDDHESLVFPPPDAHLEQHPAAPSTGPPGADSAVDGSTGPLARDSRPWPGGGAGTTLLPEVGALPAPD